MAVEDQVIARIKRGEDLELHVKITRVDDDERVNVREFVPSQDKYGRGIFVKKSEVDELIKGLKAAKSEMD